ncbi:MAG TPA: hypothetical protein VLE23_13685, partial [Geminicoccaceae bacterium]|nr:hypothetical protein [Geminicoccaceae bacterium]
DEGHACEQRELRGADLGQEEGGFADHPAGCGMDLRRVGEREGPYDRFRRGEKAGGPCGCGAGGRSPRRGLAGHP